MSLTHASIYNSLHFPLFNKIPGQIEQNAGHGYFSHRDGWILTNCNLMAGEVQDIELEISRIKEFEKTFRNTPISEWYGAGRCLKKFLGIPAATPLLLYVDHGVPIGDELIDSDFHARLPMFVMRKARQSLVQRRCGKKSYVMGSPFVHYRRMNNIRPMPDAKGTLVFPSHSTHLIDVIIDWDDYADALLRLPQHFQPIKVCMYWKDLLQGSHEPFLERGIPVVTAGHIGDPEFASKFYGILSRCLYTTSNLLGSYGFYSIEMGIPFFLYGDEPSFNNRGGDSNRPPGIYELDEKLIPGYELRCRFHFDLAKPITIDRALRELCLDKLGAEELIDRSVLRTVVFTSLLINGPRRAASRVLNHFRKLMLSERDT